MREMIHHAPHVCAEIGKGPQGPASVRNRPQSPNWFSNATMVYAGLRKGPKGSDMIRKDLKGSPRALKDPQGPSRARKKPLSSAGIRRDPPGRIGKDPMWSECGLQEKYDHG